MAQTLLIIMMWHLILNMTGYLINKLMKWKIKKPKYHPSFSPKFLRPPHIHQICNLTSEPEVDLRDVAVDEEEVEADVGEEDKVVEDGLLGGGEFMAAPPYLTTMSLPQKFSG